MHACAARCGGRGADYVTGAHLFSSAGAVGLATALALALARVLVRCFRISLAGGRDICASPISPLSAHAQASRLLYTSTVYIYSACRMH